MRQLVVSALFIGSVTAIAPAWASDSDADALQYAAHREVLDGAYGDKEARLEHWKKALDLTEQAYSASTDEMTRLHLLGRLAERAFNAEEPGKAKDYAMRALAATADSNGRRIGDNFHHAHLVLGRLALLEGDIRAAGQHLLEAGRTPGSPVLVSFGPNMSLAKLLLERGDRADVLEYLRLCGNFWKMGVESGELAGWIVVVEAGGIPDFGANLDYGQ